MFVCIRAACMGFMGAFSLAEEQLRTSGIEAYESDDSEDSGNKTKAMSRKTKTVESVHTWTFVQLLTQRLITAALITLNSIYFLSKNQLQFIIH